MPHFRIIFCLQNRLTKSHWFQSCHALGLVGVFVLSFGPMAIGSDGSDVAPQTEQTPATQVSLCDWQRDYAFFTATERTEKVETIPCEAAFVRPIASIGTDGVSVVSAVSENAAFERELRTMVSGYPIESMVPAIAEYDRDIAGLIVGIAKKESNWGKRVPRTNTGDDCFNYWGYKGAGARGVAMGHGCFGEPAEAVHAIGGRLQELVALRRTSEPANMIIWKCGSSCAGHSPESVRKWISDVDLYYREIAQK